MTGAIVRCICILGISLLVAVAAFGQQNPVILSTSPTQNQISVPVDGNITVEFDMNMTASTFNGQTFVVHASLTGLHEGIFSFQSSDHVVVFNPDEDFDIGEVVTVTLTTGIESDQTGMPLAKSHVWSFVTETIAAPGQFKSYVTIPSESPMGRATAADLNGDGFPDAVCVQPMNDNDSGTVTIHLNNGNGIIEADAAYMVVGYPWVAAAGDLNNDGAADLVVGGSGNSLSVLMNQGDGTFGEAVSFYGSAKDIDLADLNGDGYLDIVTTACGISSQFHVRLNDGTASFDNYDQYNLGTTGSFATGLSLVDLDNDGDLDIAATTAAEDLLNLLENDGSGSFDLDSTCVTGDRPIAAVAGDFNGDGYVDIVVANEYDQTISAFMNDGSGSLLTPATYAIGTDPTENSTIATDLDGDGSADLIIGDDSEAVVLLNTGSGVFDVDSNRYSPLISAMTT